MIGGDERDLPAILLPRAWLAKLHDGVGRQPALADVPPPQLPPVVHRGAEHDRRWIDTARRLALENAQRDRGRFLAQCLGLHQRTTDNAPAELVVAHGENRDGRDFPQLLERAVLRIGHARRVLGQQKPENGRVLRHAGGAHQHVVVGQVVEPFDLHAIGKRLEITAQLRSPISLDGRIADDDGHVGRLGQKLQDVLEISGKVEVQEDAGVIVGKRGARNTPQVGADDQHRRRGKQFASMALHKKCRGSARRHDQVELAPGKKRADILDERPFILRILDARGVERDLVKIDRLRRFFDELGAKTSGHIAPRRVGMTERVQQEDAPRVRRRRLDRRQ